MIVRDSRPPVCVRIRMSPRAADKIHRDDAVGAGVVLPRVRAPFAAVAERPGKVDVVGQCRVRGFRQQPPEELPKRGVVGLKPQIGHIIGFQAPISARSAPPNSGQHHRPTVKCPSCWLNVGRDRHRRTGDSYTTNSTIPVSLKHRVTSCMSVYMHSLLGVTQSPWERSRSWHTAHAGVES